MAQKKKKSRSTGTEQLMILQILETDREQVVKIGALVWAMTGAAIGFFFVLMSILMLVSASVGLSPYPASGALNMIVYSIVIAFVLAVFYGMVGGLMGILLSDAANWVLQKVGGIKLRVRRI